MYQSGIPRTVELKPNPIYQEKDELNREKSLKPQEPGVKEDAQKRRMDLIPVGPLNLLADVLTYGAKKYKDHNWRRGMSWGRPFAAALRHLYAWWGGESIDPESGLPHLAHAACSIFFLMEYEQYPKYDTFDDRWLYGKENPLIGGKSPKYVATKSETNPEFTYYK